MMMGIYFCVYNMVNNSLLLLVVGGGCLDDWLNPNFCVSLAEK